MRRRLAAILAADVVGYASLVRSDESATVAALRELRRNVFEPIVAAHGGRIFKLAGDGLFAEFPSAIEAVRCAVAVQLRLRDHAAAGPEERRVRYRMGISVGDVIIDGRDLQGDVVNVAARLEALADPGGILTTRTVVEQLRGRLDLVTEPLGEKTVKNITEPIEAFRIVLDARAARIVTLTEPDQPSALPPRRVFILAGSAIAALAGLAVWQWRRPSLRPQVDTGGVDETARPGPLSVAVLPFTVLSDDPDQAWLADGMTEDVITDLAQVSGLVVIARHATFAYRDRQVGAEDVARDLGVSHVVDGSVRREGDRIRINVWLVDGVTGGQLWGERFDETVSQVLELQDKVARRIVTALAVRLTADEEQRMALAETTSVEAYESFRRGWEQYRRQSPEAFAAARHHLEHAIELDPDYGRALAALALLYHEAFERGWARRALNLDYATARLRAGRYLQEARARRPTPLASRVASLMFLRGGSTDAALVEAEAARRLDPADAENLAAVGRALIFVGRPAEAATAIQTAMRLEVHYPPEYAYLLGLARFGEEQFTDATNDMRDALAMNPDNFRASAILAASLAYLGRLTEANAAFAIYAARLPQTSVTLHEPMSELTLIRHWPYREATDQERLAHGLELASGEPVEPIAPHAERGGDGAQP